MPVPGAEDVAARNGEIGGTAKVLNMIFHHYSPAVIISVDDRIVSGKGILRSAWKGNCT